MYMKACIFLFARESTDQSYQLLRDSLDLYLTMYPDNVQYLMLQARLYFHLGIWPEKVLGFVYLHFIHILLYNTWSRLPERNASEIVSSL